MRRNPGRLWGGVICTELEGYIGADRGDGRVYSGRGKQNEEQALRRRQRATNGDPV